MLRRNSRFSFGFGLGGLGVGEGAPAGFTLLTGLDGVPLTGLDLQTLLGVSQGPPAAPAPPPALSITGTPVTTAVQSSPYTPFTVTGHDGTAPYTYSLQGSWPTGISVDSSSGIVSGTPSNSGTFTGLSVRATDVPLATADLATFQILVSPAGSYDADALRIFAGHGSAPNTTRKDLIQTLISAMKACGSWAVHDLLYIPAAADQTGGNYEWMAGTLNLSPVNAPTFTTDRGYTFNGTTQECTTGWDAATNGVHYTRNDMHLMCYTLTNGSSTGFDFGEVTGTVAGVKSRTGTLGSVRAQFGTSLPPLAGGTQPLCIMGMRRASTTSLVYRDGAPNTSAAQTSVAVSSVDWSIGHAISLFSDRQIALVSAGGAMDDTMAAADFAAKKAFLQGLGAVP